jgi:hypothetical protein
MMSRMCRALKRTHSPVTMLETFDTPPMAPNCIERPQSTVATQALQLMNAPVMTEHARYLAGRIIDAAADQRGRIGQVYLRVLSRPAGAAEVERGAAALARLTERWRAHLGERNEAVPREWMAQWHALGDFIHTMLNSAEFAYVD